MPTAPVQPLPQHQRVSVDVELKDNNGNIDTTTALSLTYNATLLECAIDPANNRRITVKALTGGNTNTTLVVNRQGTVVAEALTLPFLLQAALNLSIVTLVAINPLPPV